VNPREPLKSSVEHSSSNSASTAALHHKQQQAAAKAISPPRNHSNHSSSLAELLEHELSGRQTRGGSFPVVEVVTGALVLAAVVAIVVRAVMVYMVNIDREASKNKQSECPAPPAPEDALERIMKKRREDRERASEEAGEDGRRPTIDEGTGTSSLAPRPRLPMQAAPTENRGSITIRKMRIPSAMVDELDMSMATTEFGGASQSVMTTRFLESTTSAGFAMTANAAETSMPVDRLDWPQQHRMAAAQSSGTRDSTATRESNESQFAIASCGSAVEGEGRDPTVHKEVSLGGHERADEELFVGAGPELKRMLVRAHTWDARKCDDELSRIRGSTSGGDGGTPQVSPRQRRETT
jgi:hypothetical protein